MPGLGPPAGYNLKNTTPSLLLQYPSLPSFSFLIKQKGRTAGSQAIPLACSPGPRSCLHHRVYIYTNIYVCSRRTRGAGWCERSLSVLCMLFLHPLCLACCPPGSAPCLSVCLSSCPLFCLYSFSSSSLPSPNKPLLRHICCVV